MSKEYKGVPPYCDTWVLISNLHVCKMISANRDDGISRFEEPYDNPFIDFYCELDAYLIDQPLLGIIGYEKGIRNQFIGERD